MPETLADPAAHDRAIAMFAAATPPMGAPIEAWRAGFERLCAAFPVPDDADIQDLSAGAVGGLSVRAPSADPARVVLHFHSGGYVMGSASGYRNFAYRLSEVSGATVLLPAYRLAPEHPYPAAVEDGVAAYEWAVARYGTAQLAVSGDSAGGGLCIAVLMRIRDSGLPAPRCGAAISPLLDLAGEGESAITKDGIDPLINRTMVVEMGKVYLGRNDPHATPLASPLWGRHEDLPPLFLTASGDEVLRDDAVRLADSVRRAGGQVELHVPPGLVHIWTLFPFLPEAAATMRAMGEFLRGYV